MLIVDDQYSNARNGGEEERGDHQPVLGVWHTPHPPAHGLLGL